MIRVMITDDHTIMREGLKRLFSITPDIHTQAEAPDGDSTLLRLAQGDIDVLLLDMTMGGLCGEALIKEIRRRHPALPILVLSMHNDPRIVQDALRAGAHGYVPKDRDPETLLLAIRRVAEGRRYLDPSLAQDVAFEAALGPLPQARAERLTARERQVLALLARDVSLKDISERLHISYKTVAAHKKNIMKKMEFKNNGDLIRYALSYPLPP